MCANSAPAAADRAAWIPARKGGLPRSAAAASYRSWASVEGGQGGTAWPQARITLRYLPGGRGARGAGNGIRVSILMLARWWGCRRLGGKRKRGMHGAIAASTQQPRAKGQGEGCVGMAAVPVTWACEPCCQHPVMHSRAAVHYRPSGVGPSTHGCLTGRGSNTCCALLLPCGGAGH